MRSPSSSLRSAVLLAAAFVPLDALAQSSGTVTVAFSGSGDGFTHASVPVQYLSLIHI